MIVLQIVVIWAGLLVLFVGTWTTANGGDRDTVGLAAIGAILTLVGIYGM